MVILARSGSGERSDLVYSQGIYGYIYRNNRDSHTCDDDITGDIIGGLEHSRVHRSVVIGLQVMGS